jgi:hypothetical protein
MAKGGGGKASEGRGRREARERERERGREREEDGEEKSIFHVLHTNGLACSEKRDGSGHLQSAPPACEKRQSSGMCAWNDEVQMTFGFRSPVPLLFPRPEHPQEAGHMPFAIEAVADPLCLSLSDHDMNQQEREWRQARGGEI